MPSYFDNLESAFPLDAQVLVLAHADSTARSSFMVCGLCGNLVLESLHVTHVMNQHCGDKSSS